VFVPAAASRAIQLEASVLLLREKNDQRGTALEFGPSGRVLHAGQWVEFRVRNKGAKPADITAFFVASDFEIRAIFPMAERQLDTRLEPGAEIVLARTRVTDDTVGEEDLAIVGLPATIPPVNLTILAQSGAGHEFRNAPLQHGDGLAALVAEALDGTRGLQQLEADGDYGVTLLSWRTSP
jgi:hypothetical protein